MTYIRFCAALTLAATLAFGQNIDSSRIRYTAAGGGTQQTLATKLAEHISVKDFGAKGDGVTDDAPAFQAAVNSLATGAHGTIYCPATSASYYLGSNVLTNGRNPQFLLSFGCSITGIGAIPLNNIHWDNSYNYYLPGGLNVGAINSAAITATGNISTTGTLSSTGSFTATAGITSGGIIQTPALKADATSSTLIVYDKNGNQVAEFYPPYFFIGNPLNTHNIGWSNTSNTLSVYDYNSAANIANYASTQIEFFPQVKFDSSINSPITSTGLIWSQSGGIKFPDNTTQTSAGIQPSSAAISTNTSVSASGSKNQTFSATGTITVTLYDATLVPAGIVNVQNAGTGTITIATSAGQTINGQSTVTLIRQYDSFTLQSVAGNWVIN